MRRAVQQGGRHGGNGGFVPAGVGVDQGNPVPLEGLQNRFRIRDGASARHLLIHVAPADDGKVCTGLRPDAVDDVDNDPHPVFRAPAVGVRPRIADGGQEAVQDIPRRDEHLFAGDADAPFDRRSYELWQQVGLPAKRLAKLGKENNWWGLASHLGPCGPDTEVFYWTGPEPAPEIFEPNDPAWVEIWNNVFMAYDEQADGSFVPLKQRNVDTGLGLERVLAVLNHESDIYLSDLFQPIISYLQKVSGRSYLCLLYTSPSPRDRTRSRMPSSA